jgi:hypothetical protein
VGAFFFPLLPFSSLIRSYLLFGSTHDSCQMFAYFLLLLANVCILSAKVSMIHTYIHTYEIQSRHGADSILNFLVLSGSRVDEHCFRSRFLEQ